MRSIGVFSDLVAAIHNAAVSPGGWSAVLNSIKHATGAELGGLIMQGSGRAPDIIETTGIDPMALATYRTHYRRLDPVMPALLCKPEGLVITQRMVVNRADMLRTEFYNDWLRPQRVDDCLAVTVATGSQPGVMAFAVPARAAHFDADAIHLLRLLVPHVRIAVRTHLHLQGVTLERDNALAALGRLRCSVFLIDAAGRVVLANRPGEALLRDARLLSGGGAAGLFGPTQDQTSALRHAIARACGQMGGGEAASVVTFWRASTESPCTIMIVPLAADNVARSIGHARAMLLVVPPSEDMLISLRLLRVTFGLTPTEARVAQIVGQGHGVAATALALGLSSATVRTHLLRIFSKTGTRRQAELASLLGRLAMMTGEPDAIPAKASPEPGRGRPTPSG
ncbi:MAG: helix-turn-helix transcriptional regulator [Acetobacteraceae bacterium]